MKPINYVSVVYTDTVEFNDHEIVLDKQYTFRNFNVKNIEVNDYVVVMNRNGTMHTAKVKGILLDNYINADMINKAISYIVDRIDVSLVKHIEETSARRKYLKLKLKEKREAMEDMLIYKAIAAEDEEAAKMLNELKELES